jgi:hypothetical protein
MSCEYRTAKRRYMRFESKMAKPNIERP